MTTVHDIRQKFADILSAFFDFLEEDVAINHDLQTLHRTVRQEEDKANMIRTLKDIDNL